MSRLLRQTDPAEIASLGGFVLRRGEAAFRPRPSAAFGLAGENDLDGEDEAEADAYAQGYADARATIELEIAAERDAIAQLANSLEALKPEPTGALAMLLAETVDRLVRQVVGEVEIDGITLLARAREAAELIGKDTEPSRLRAHPEDAALLETAELDIELIADPALERGALVLETGHGWIEDGPTVRLERLRAELDRMGAK
jgi:flagellar assembly protein FliH